jgi:hypothetical protein
MTTPASVQLADDLRLARTEWLVQHGVPISFEFANFAEMVGVAEKFLRQPVVAAAPELLAALQNIHQHMIGMAAYFATCNTEVIIDNLETTIHTLHEKTNRAEAAIAKARKP